jgi:UDP-N-acetylmuramate--alanine ligase
VHFAGIGGVSMSAIAHMALECGATVSGCDVQESDRTRALAARGCDIRIGHDPAHLNGAELVVRSSAVPETEPEIVAALRRHIPVISRARMLARLTGDQRLVAVSGSHGKTTTTWLATRLLLEARYDPSAMIGGFVPELGSSYRLGGGGFFVIEADESDGSLLEFRPHHAIVTNLDREHVDRYPDLAALQDVFRTFLSRVQPDGCAILCADDEPTMAVRDALEGDYLTYGFRETADIRGESLRLGPRASTLDVQRPGDLLRDLRVSLPGPHNAQNALAVVALATALGIGDEALRAALGHAGGVARRLEPKGTAAGVAVLDDYAHHPTEIRAALESARRMAGGRLIGVFQPHRYTRTLHLAAEFGACFDALDHLVVLPIYPAGEQPIEGVSAQLIVEAVREHGEVEVVFCGGHDAALAHLLGLVAAGDTVITIGAGDVHEIGEALLAELSKRGQA